MKICNYNEITEEFFSKIEFENIDSVKAIIKDVRENKDSAIKKYCREFDGEIIDNFKLTREEIEHAINSTDSKTIDAIKFAIKNVEDFAKAQLNSIKELEVNINGNILGHKIIPLDSVGCYIPGGNYPLPSSAVMTIVPAKVAGVKRISAASPKIKPVTIAAAA